MPPRDSAGTDAPPSEPGAPPPEPGAPPPEPGAAADRLALEDGWERVSIHGEGDAHRTNSGAAGEATQDAPSLGGVGRQDAATDIEYENMPDVLPELFFGVYVCFQGVFATEDIYVDGQVVATPGQSGRVVGATQERLSVLFGHGQAQCWIVDVLVHQVTATLTSAQS